MARLILIRHGQSVWNKENKFTGWIDVSLSEQGKKEASLAGKHLLGFSFDKAFTSNLKRAHETLAIVLEEAKQEDLEVIRNQALNERHYGDLQGLNKAETAKKFGDEQIFIWRRSYDIAPPNGESLKDTAGRVIPYVENNIFPELRADKNILVVAHGNSLRALIMKIENISEEAICKLEIPTGVPIVYDLDKNENKNENLKILDKKIFDLEQGD